VEQHAPFCTTSNTTIKHGPHLIVLNPEELETPWRFNRFVGRPVQATEDSKRANEVCLYLLRPTSLTQIVLLTIKSIKHSCQVSAAYTKHYIPYECRIAPMCPKDTFHTNRQPSTTLT
jgi:hypothetical protein